MKSAAEINAERLEKIILTFRHQPPFFIARKIVEAFPELRPAQQSMDEYGRTKTIPEQLPWAT